MSEMFVDTQKDLGISFIRFGTCIILLDGGYGDPLLAMSRIKAEWIDVHVQLYLIKRLIRLGAWKENIYAQISVRVGRFQAEWT